MWARLVGALLRRRRRSRNAPESTPSPAPRTSPIWVAPPLPESPPPPPPPPPVWLIPPPESPPPPPPPPAPPTEPTAGPHGTQVRLLLADGSVVQPQGDPVLMERIAYVASSLWPEVSSPVTAVEIGSGDSPAQGAHRVRLVLEDGSEIDPGADAELARHIEYLAANLLPKNP